MDVDIPIQSIAHAIVTDPTVTKYTEDIKRIPNNRAVIRLKVIFFDSSILHFTELIDSSPCFPVFMEYSYQYMKNERQVFLYDNRHAYPELSTSPEHKHVGPKEANILEAKNRPSHTQLFKEIRSFLDL